MNNTPQQHVKSLALAALLFSASQVSAAGLSPEHLEVIALTQTELVIYDHHDNTLYVGSGGGNLHYNDYHLDTWQLVAEGSTLPGDLPTINEAAQGSGIAIKQWDWGDARAVFSCDGIDLILERLLADGSHEEVLVTHIEQQRCTP
jgi:hypothetical protein